MLSCQNSCQIDWLIVQESYDLVFPVVLHNLLISLPIIQPINEYLSQLICIPESPLFALTDDKNKQKKFDS